MKLGIRSADGYRLANEASSPAPQTRLSQALKAHADAKRNPNVCPYCDAGVGYVHGGHLVFLGMDGVRCTHCLGQTSERPLRHGLPGYHKGCRCDKCKKAGHAMHQRRWRQEKAKREEAKREAV